MCNILDDVRNEFRISYNVKSDAYRLNRKNLFSMFTGNLPEGLCFDTFLDGEFVEIHYYSDKFVLFSKYLESNNKCNLSFYVKKLCELIINDDDNSFLLELNQIFCDENGLYLIPSLFVNDGIDCLQHVKHFLKSISDVSDEYAEKINDIREYADNTNVSVEDILKYIDALEQESTNEQKLPTYEVVRRCPKCGAEYENKYVFCMKCGGKLIEVNRETDSFDLETINEASCENTHNTKSERKIIEQEVCSDVLKIEETAAENKDKTEAIENFNPEKTVVRKLKRLKIKGLAHNASENEIKNTSNQNSAVAEKDSHYDDENVKQAAPVEDKSPYGETTLLGFTNYGETAVLSGMSNSFDTPNLIRKSTDEKIYITKRTFIIGKSADKADYAVNNSAVSRVHAEISVVGSEYYVTDKDSTNHTYVNNTMIQSNSPHQVFDGDEIMFANEIYIFHLQ